MAVKGLGISVWRARVIDIMSAVAAAAAVKTPAVIDAANPKYAPMRPAVGLEVRDALAAVFSNFSPTLEGNRGEAALAVNRGLFYRQTNRQPWLHPTISMPRLA